LLNSTHVGYSPALSVLCFIFCAILFVLSLYCPGWSWSSNLSCAVYCRDRVLYIVQGDRDHPICPVLYIVMILCCILSWSCSVYCPGWSWSSYLSCAVCCRDPVLYIVQGDRDHPICPVMLGDAKLAVDFADLMLSRFLLVFYILACLKQINTTLRDYSPCV